MSQEEEAGYSGWHTVTWASVDTGGHSQTPGAHQGSGWCRVLFSRSQVIQGLGAEALSSRLIDWKMGRAHSEAGPPRVVPGKDQGV